MGYHLSQIEQSLAHESEDDLGSTTQDSSSSAPMLLSLDIGQKTVHDETNDFYQWSQQPLAAISVGDPDTADTTTFGAPGMGSGTHNMESEVAIAERMHQDLEQIGEGSHAAVTWVGYDPPAAPGESGDTASVMTNGRASEGGWDFAYALDGFYDTRVAQGDDSSDFTVNVHAHSYGTNMSAHALTRVEHPVDTFSMYGSSGIPKDVADHASDFKVAEGADGEPMVFASESSQDRLAFVGRLPLSRQDPTADGFGAQEHYSGHPYEGDASDLEDVTGHSKSGDTGDPSSYGYLDRGTVHYRNLTRILAGNHGNILSTEEYTEDREQWREVVPGGP